MFAGCALGTRFQSDLKLKVSLSFQFIYLPVVTLLIVTSDPILVVRLKQKNSSSSLARCSPAACDDRIWTYSGPGPGQFSDVFFFFFCDNHRDGGCRYQKND